MTALILRGMFLTSLSLAVSGCGFHPLYMSRDVDSDAPVAMDLNNVAIETSYDLKNEESNMARNSQILRNDLIDRMYGHNRPLQPLYKLSIRIHYNEEDLGIQANATATRSLLNMYADYSLANANGAPLLNGSAHAVAGFEKLDQMYGTVAARQSAYENTLHEVSEQIVNRLSLYFSEHK